MDSSLGPFTRGGGAGASASSSAREEDNDEEAGGEDARAMRARDAAHAVARGARQLLKAIPANSLLHREFVAILIRKPPRYHGAAGEAAELLGVQHNAAASARGRR